MLFGYFGASLGRLLLGLHLACLHAARQFEAGSPQEFVRLDLTDKNYAELIRQGKN